MTPAEIRGAYARTIRAAGEPIRLQRLVSTTPLAYAGADLWGRPTDYGPHELVGDVQQGDRRLIIAAAELEAAGWGGDPERGDQVLLQAGAVTTTVEYVDSTSRRLAGVQIGYELRIRG